MRVIITGGTGLIGSEVAARLGQAGHEVIVLSRNPNKYQFPPGVRGVTWDAKTAQGWGELADGADAIINLAGESIRGDGFIPSRWTPERKQRILDSRLNVGKAIVEAIEAAETKPRVLLQSSAVDYYSNRGDDVLTADAAPGSGFLADVCVDWEASTASVEAMGVRRPVLRTGIVLMMEGGALPITALPFRFFVGGKLGSGEQWWPWIHIEDEVRAILFLLENDAADGPFNLCAPNPLKNKDFAQAIGKVLGRPSLIPVPKFALEIALGEVSSVVLNSRRAVPQRLQELGFTFKYPDAESALQDLLND